MITTAKFFNTSITSQRYHFFFVVRTPKIYFLNKFQVFNSTVLITVTMLDVTHPELTLYLKVCALWPTFLLSLPKIVFL